MADPPLVRPLTKNADLVIRDRYGHFLWGSGLERETAHFSHALELMDRNYEDLVLNYKAQVPLCALGCNMEMTCGERKRGTFSCVNSEV
jgi:hypothetical protein